LEIILRKVGDEFASFCGDREQNVHPVDTHREGAFHAIVRELYVLNGLLRGYPEINSEETQQRELHTHTLEAANRLPRSFT
jgi:hypothetical protein